MTPPRTPLPHRRPSLTVSTEWSGIPFTVTLGCDPASGRIREVFADTATGGQMQAALADACVLISIALQHDLTAAALAKSLAREPDPMAGADATRPASPIGAILQAILAEEVAAP